MLPTKIALGLLGIIPPSLSWTIDAHLDLAFPPRWTAPPGDAYMSRNGTFLSPNYLDSCLNQEVPANVTRSMFHVSQGRVVFDLVNASRTNAANESFHMDIYLPHLWYRYVGYPNGTRYNTGRQAKFKSGGNMWRFHKWQNFPQKGRCFLPLNMTAMVVDEMENPVTEQDLVGLHATLMFGPKSVRNYKVFEEVDQCAYVTLTNEKVQQEEVNVPCESFDPNWVDPQKTEEPSKGMAIMTGRDWKMLSLTLISITLLS